jgi:hypothetical protein
MTAKIDAFLTEIRARPEFVAAAAANPQRVKDMLVIEQGVALLYLYPAFIDVLDELDAVVARRDLSIKQRLDEVTRILTQARDAGRAVH